MSVLISACLESPAAQWVIAFVILGVLIAASWTAIAFTDRWDD